MDKMHIGCKVGFWIIIRLMHVDLGFNPENVQVVTIQAFEPTGRVALKKPLTIKEFQDADEALSLTCRPTIQ